MHGIFSLNCQRSVIILSPSTWTTLWILRTRPEDAVVNGYTFQTCTNWYCYRTYSEKKNENLFVLFKFNYISFEK